MKITFSGLIHYRGGIGQLIYILHRLTGLGILGFLVVHIFDTATVFFAPALYADAIALYRNPVFLIGEIFLVFSVIYHGVNGARIALFDLIWVKKWALPAEPRTAVWTLIIAIVLWLPAAIIMTRNLIANL